jgi:hypothetical protein
MRLENIVNNVENKKIKQVIRTLRKFEEGTNSWADEWVFESMIWRKSALIRTWHNLSMNTSL